MYMSTLLLSADTPEESITDAMPSSVVSEDSYSLLTYNK